MKHLAILGSAVATVALFVGMAVPLRGGQDRGVVPARADFGSGTLGNWPTMSHGIVGNWSTAEVGLIGDSVTTRCYRSLATLVARAGSTLAVNYWSGRPATPAVDWLLAQPRTPRVLLVQSGPSDIFDPPAVTAQVVRLKAGLPIGTRLLWSDVQVARTRYAPAVQLADQRNSLWVNNQLRENLPKSQIIPWSSWFSSSPGRVPYYLQDGVHPWATAGTGHGDGCAFWAAAMMSAAASAIR
ncbi:hypothetical protein AB0E63_19655 [Kribbella sp. NPDC026596]|uniref:hypothetical protein n=1 Tax=Kribbella sp. NPDC026596 TaxID=3155122 RepID=UPI0034056CB7